MASKLRGCRTLGINVGDTCLLLTWCPAWKRHDLELGSCAEHGNLSFRYCDSASAEVRKQRVNAGKATSSRNCKSESTDTEHRGGATRSSVETCENRRSEGVALSRFVRMSTQSRKNS
jgi:hypothetical protein